MSYNIYLNNQMVNDTSFNGFNSAATSNNTLTGTDGGDTLNGTSAAELINGLAGHDTITGGGGADTLKGGDGYDTIYASASNATIDGGNDWDSLHYDTATAAVEVNLKTGSVTGGSGVDTIYNIEDVHGSAFNDTFFGSFNKDYFYGNEGNDSLFGEDGDDKLIGGAGSDLLDGGAGGLDFADYSYAPAGVTADLATGVANDGEGGIDSLIGIEGLYGSKYGDNKLFGDAGSNQLIAAGLGRLTNNILDGRAGDDKLGGSDGNDTLIGGDGNDIAQFYGDFTDYGIVYNANTAMLTITDKTTNLNNSGPGIDTVSGVEQFRFFENNLTINKTLNKTLAEMIATATNKNSAPNLTGTSGNDALYGKSTTDLIDGLAGNDALYGYAGNDSLYGWAGDDYLVGGKGDDILNGGAGVDAVDYYYYDTTGPVTVNLNQRTATGAGIGTDSLKSIEIVYGSYYADTLIGDSNTNYLCGIDGNDKLDGSQGDDSLWGWTGDDKLYGGKGKDLLYGGTGADTFYFDSNSDADTINDFNKSEDKIAIVSGTNGITTPAQAVAHLTTNTAGAAVLDLGQGTVTLVGVSAASLNSSMFTIGAYG